MYNVGTQQEQSQNIGTYQYLAHIIRKSSFLDWMLIQVSTLIKGYGLSVGEFSAYVCKYKKAIFDQNREWMYGQYSTLQYQPWLKS